MGWLSNGPIPDSLRPPASVCVVSFFAFGVLLYFRVFFLFKKNIIMDQ